MSIQVTQLDHDRFTVNEKLVIKTPEGNFKALNEPLTAEESQVFWEFINAAKMSFKNRLN